MLTLGKALKSSQRLSSITLLDTNVNIRLLCAIGLLEIVVVGVKGIGCRVINHQLNCGAVAQDIKHLPWLARFWMLIRCRSIQTRYS